jgi:hypothetical protein
MRGFRFLADLPVSHVSRLQRVHDSNAALIVTAVPPAQTQTPKECRSVWVSLVQFDANLRVAVT